MGSRFSLAAGDSLAEEVKVEMEGNSWRVGVGVVGVSQ